MKKIIGIMMLCLMLFGCDASLTNDENIKIIVASDLHYFLREYYKDCDWFEENLLNGDGKMVSYGDEILDAFVSKVKEIKPHLVVIPGDLTFNGEIGSHREVAKKLLQLKDEGIEVAVIPGNHDVDNIFTKGYGKDDYIEVDNINASEFREIYKDLGYQNKRHEESLSYRIDLNKRYSLLMVDSCAHELTGANLDIGGYLTDSTKEWLAEQLKDITGDEKIPLVSFHHSLVSHNDLLGGKYTIRDNKDIVKLLKEYNVPFVLTGHIHHQNIKQIEGIYDIASSSLLDAPLQYGIIELDSHEMNYHTDSLTISKDSNEYFDLVSSTHFAESFEVIKDEKKREDMKDVIVLANRYFFTGNMDLHKEEIMNMPGYKYYLQEIPKGLEFYKTYLNSMLCDDQNHQELTLKLK